MTDEVKDRFELFTEMLRIRRFEVPFEGFELLAPASAHGFDELGIRMADKILKRRLFTVFFAHEN